MRIPAVSASEIDKNTIGGGDYINRTYQTYVSTYITDSKQGFNDVSVVDSTGSLIATSNLNETSASGSYLAGCYIVKYDSTGSISWQKRIISTGSGFGNLFTRGIALDNSDNIYVLFALNANTGTTINQISKFNSAGTLQWEKRLINPSWTNATFYGLSSDTSNNIYVTGQSYGGTTQGWNAATTKIDSSGAIVWTKEQYTNNYDQALSNIVDSSGNVYVIGSTDIVFSPSYTKKLTITKYNSSGTTLWNRVFDSGGFIDGYQPALDSSGNLYIPIYYNLSGGSSTYYGGILKYNSSGVLQWQKRILIGASSPAVGTILIDASDNLYVSFNGITSRIFVLKLDTSGAVISGATQMIDTVMNTNTSIGPYTLSVVCTGLNLVGSTLYWTGYTALTTVLPSFQNGAMLNYKLPVGSSKFGIYAIPNQYSFQFYGDPSYATFDTTMSESAWSPSNQNANLTMITSATQIYNTGALINQVIN